MRVAATLASCAALLMSLSGCYTGPPEDNVSVSKKGVKVTHLALIEPSREAAPMTIEEGPEEVTVRMEAWFNGQLLEHVFLEEREGRATLNVGSDRSGEEFLMSVTVTINRSRLTPGDLLYVHDIDSGETLAHFQLK